MHIFLLLLLTCLTQGPVPGAPAPQSLEIQVIDAESGEPLPGARLFWLGALEHETQKSNRVQGWPWEGHAATEQRGQEVKLDAGGVARIEAPVGGTLLVAKTEFGFGYMQVLPDQAQCTLRVFADFALDVRVVDPGGNAVTGINAWLVKRIPDGNGGTRERWAGAAVLDAQGNATFGRVRFAVFRDSEIIGESFQAMDLRVVLHVVGDEPTTFPVHLEDWRAGHMSLVTPPLGYVEILQDEARATWSDGQALFAYTSLPMRTATGQQSFRSLPMAGDKYRFAIRLNTEVHVLAIGGECVSTLIKKYEGPSQPQEVAVVGPLQPENHIRLTLVTGLTPDVPEGDRTSLHVRPRRPGEFGHMARARVLQKDLRPDGSFDLWVPASLSEDATDALDVTVYRQSQTLAFGVVAGGFGDQRRIPIAIPDLAGRSQVDSYGLIPNSPTIAVAAMERVCSGIVIDGSGQPIPGARVFVEEDSVYATNTSWQASPDCPRSGLSTDRAGRFEFHSGSQAVRFRLRAKAGFLATAQQVEVARGTAEERLVLLAGVEKGYAIRRGPESFVLRRNSKPLQLLTPEGNGLARRKVRVQWIPLCDALDGRVFRESPQSVTSDLLGQLSVRQPSGKDGPWQLCLFTCDGVRPHYFARVALDPYDASWERIALEALEPFASGTLLDDRGETIENARLQLRASKESPNLEGQIVSSTVEANGTFELYALPGNDSAQLILSSPSEVFLQSLDSSPRFARDANQVPIKRGTHDLKLVAMRWGGFSVGFQLPRGLQPGHLDVELIGENLWARERHSGRSFQNSLAFHRLRPGEYRVRVSLPKETVGPKGRMDTIDRILYESAPFAVSPGSLAESNAMETIDLSRVLRVIEARIAIDGDSDFGGVDSMHLASTDGQPLRFCARLGTKGTAVERLLVEPRRAIRIAARKIVDADSAIPITLQSEVGLISEASDQVNLLLSAAPPYHLRFDPALIEVARPYVAVAVLAPGDRLTTSPWIHAWPTYEERAPVGVQLGADGSVSFPGFASLPGERQLDAVHLGVAFLQDGSLGALQELTHGAYPNGTNSGWSFRFYLPGEEEQRDAALKHFRSLPWMELVQGELKSASGRDSWPTLWTCDPANHRTRDRVLSVSLERFQSAVQRVEERGNRHFQDFAQPVK